MGYEKATKPTMYFIGVTTAQSSIMKLFPQWAKEMGIDAVIKGMDLPIHADDQAYTECVDFIKNDPFSMGALVTTHKIDLYNAAKQYFEYLDPYATMFSELSSISKKDGRLEGYAKDPISSGLAMEAFIPVGYFQEHGGEVVIMGAGGSALAISSYLVKKEHGDDMPSKIIITNRSMARLESAKEHLKALNTDVEFEYIYCPNPEDNDRVVESLKPYAFVVNATGLGKDRPGSPVTDTCKFPKNALVWELNYRGSLEFLHQANRQKEEQGLYVEDGWIYFIHGWTQVIAEVFHVDITGSLFDRLEKLAMDMRNGK